MADLILFNTNVITMDPARPRAELVAVNNGKILSATTNHNLKEHKKKKTKVIDLIGKTILPSFILKMNRYCYD